MARPRGLPPSRSNLTGDDEHHHAVFTLPGALRPLFFANQNVLYGAFMKVVADTVRWGSRRAIGDATPAFTSYTRGTGS